MKSLNVNSSVGERASAINKALDAGITQGIVDAAKDFPKGTVMITYGPMGSTGSFVKTGVRGKDGWRNIRTFEKSYTASLLYGGTNHISADKR